MTGRMDGSLQHFRMSLETLHLFTLTCADTLCTYYVHGFEQLVFGADKHLS